MLRQGNALKAQAMAVVREVLEGVLSPDLAHSLLFDALDTLVSPPQAGGEWLEFVQGALHQVIAQRVGAFEANEISVRVQKILGTVAPLRSDADDTGRFERAVGPTRVLVLAPSARLARMLKAVLGPTIVAMSVSDLSSYEDMVRELNPSILLVDLTARRTVHHADIEAALDKLPAQVLILIWDECTPEGQALASALDGSSHPVAWVDRREGVEPLLDHIRAHYV